VPCYLFLSLADAGEKQMKRLTAAVVLVPFSIFIISQALKMVASAVQSGSLLWMGWMVVLVSIILGFIAISVLISLCVLQYSSWRESRQQHVKKPYLENEFVC
jgi:hypothetical protein